eukprot:CAMPEP_0176423324 /NCGR_PEP_ID=MMETSP0127-20121128/10217_1 /TAXON_ID=938130 /ORGANISM="Platyophrya macrostoma, Strain WH" /LENGTH=352 /DNA_ID=CAMNT_0017804255 /DNA_START=71 /DNA_END=1129 /DNA_ORIENTATION=+
MTLTVLAGHREYYDILGITPRANPDEIKSAWRKVSREKHPDKNKGDPNAEELYAKINRAYHVLSDKEKRRIYDQKGEEGVQKHEANQEAGGGGMNPFDMFFGGGRRQENKGPDLRIKMPVTLEDIYNGKEVTMFMTKQMICPHCRGTGADDPDDMKTCPVCNGQGHVTKKQQIMMGFFQQVQVTCDNCEGKGTTYNTKCHVCGAAKVIEQGVDELSVFIEKGIKHGQKMTFSGVGNEYADKAASDVHFEIVEVPHPVFTRKDNDLHMKMNLTLHQALLGFSKKVKHLDGRILTIESDKVVQPGQILKVEGEGMPLHEYSSQHGDLYIEYVVNIPKKFTEEQMSLLKTFFMGK